MAGGFLRLTVKKMMAVVYHKSVICYSIKIDCLSHVCYDILNKGSRENLPFDVTVEMQYGFGHGRHHILAVSAVIKKEEEEEE